MFFGFLEKNQNLSSFLCSLTFCATICWNFLEICVDFPALPLFVCVCLCICVAGKLGWSFRNECHEFGTFSLITSWWESVGIAISCFSLILVWQRSTAIRVLEHIFRIEKTRLVCLWKLFKFVAFNSITLLRSMTLEKCFGGF